MKMSRTIKPLILLGLLLSLFLIPHVNAPTENNSTLYFQASSTRWTMNSQLGQKFDHTNTVISFIDYIDYPSYSEGDTLYWSIDLLVRHKNNTQVTLGLKVAQVSGVVDSSGYLDVQGYHNGTVTISSNKTLLRSSTIVVKVYGKLNSGAWALFSDGTYSSIFTSPSLGAIWLNATTLTVSYWCDSMDLGDGTLVQIWDFGGSGSDQNGFITNFLFDYGLSISEAPIPSGLSFSSGVMFVGVMAACVCVVVLAAGLSLKKRR
jgi:hypothetical protein